MAVGIAGFKDLGPLVALTPYTTPHQVLRTLAANAMPVATAAGAAGGLNCGSHSNTGGARPCVGKRAQLDDPLP